MLAARSACANSSRSNPAQNVDPAPVSTTARTAGSVAQLSSWSVISLRSLIDNALRRSGRARVSVATPSSATSVSMSRLIAPPKLAGQLNLHHATWERLRRAELRARPGARDPRRALDAAHRPRRLPWTNPLRRVPAQSRAGDERAERSAAEVGGARRAGANRAARFVSPHPEGPRPVPGGTDPDGLGRPLRTRPRGPRGPDPAHRVRSRSRR